MSNHKLPTDVYIRLMYDPDKDSKTGIKVERVDINKIIENVYKQGYEDGVKHGKKNE